MYGKEYVVYLDVFFLINFTMDYIVLKLTSIVMRKKIRKLRISAAAIFGAVYSVIIIQPLLHHLRFVTFISIAAAFVMVWLAFGFGDIVTYLKNTIFLACVSFMLGGIMNYLYYTTDLGKHINNVLHGTSNQVVNARKFIFITFVAYIILLFVSKVIMAYKKELNLIVEVKLSRRGKSVVTKALFDTGNSLIEPISGNMVHIAEYKILKPMLEGDESAKENICVIPFHSVGEENGMLYGIRIDEMVVLINGEPKFLYHPVIAVYEGVLSESGRYSMILNKDTLENI